MDVFKYARTGVWLIALALPASGEEGRARFRDVAPALGITYERTPSEIDKTLQALKESGPITMEQLAAAPLRARGLPGVAILDYDGDGDLDLYVTNGPGTPNCLYRNSLVPAGSLGFDDAASSSGAALRELDSTGVCYGDTDNDGDPDLLVLNRAGATNRFLENHGGSFVDRTHQSDLGGYGARIPLRARVGGVRWSGAQSSDAVPGDQGKFRAHRYPAESC